MGVDPSDPWLTVAEIANELRLKPATIRTWIADGTLQARRTGKRKWLVRRSELERMSRGKAEAEAPPRTPSDPARAEHPLDPDGPLGEAAEEWRSAIMISRDAPPDRWYLTRVRLIARAAAGGAGALGHLAADDEVRWGDAPLDARSGLSYELRPGANRPGPPELWDQFDDRVRALAVATEVGRAGMLSAALSELAVTLHDIAEQLERYRTAYGDWLPHPADPFAGESLEPRDADPPAEDEGVS